MGHHDGRPFILVVEDQASLRHLIVRMLESGGFDTVGAGVASDGLALVRQRRGIIDLAVVDIVMPGMSGLDLATDFDREFPDLKILYISGYVDSIAADVLSRQSPERVLLKPFTQEELLDRVRLLLGIPPAKKLAPSNEPSLPPIQRDMLE